MQDKKEIPPATSEDLVGNEIFGENSHDSVSTEINSSLSEDEIEGMSKKQLSEKLSEYLESEDSNAIFSAAKLVKTRFDELAKEEFERKLRVFIQDGSPAEDFEPKPDPMDEKVNQLWEQLNSKRISQRRIKEKQSLENLSSKKMILEELKELLKGNENFKSSYNKFQALQSKWRATGNVPPQENHNLKENYFFLTGKFYDMVKINNELRELDRKKNDELKEQICEKAMKLVEEPSIRKALTGLGQLQKEWSEIRNSSKDLGDNLWQRFKSSRDKIIERKKEFEHRVKSEQETNLAVKTNLCRQMELLAETELVAHKICREVSEKENSIWEEWQKTGFVPKSDNGNCWKQFKIARQHLHKKLDAYYSKQRKESGQNLEKKKELCVKAESLQESKDWMSTAEELKKLQSEWKNIGPVPPKDSEPVWLRFRKACDHFFTNKNNFHAEKENALRTNVKTKEAIISKTDLIQPPADFQQCSDVIKKLQEEWTKSPEVPSRDQERLNNAFGKAIENLLERMKSNSTFDEKLFYRLKYEQLLKSPHGLEQVKKDRFTLKEKIKKLEAEAIQLDTNLSFFGKSKNTSPLIAEYREKLEITKNEISMLLTKLKFIPHV